MVNRDTFCTLCGPLIRGILFLYLFVFLIEGLSALFRGTREVITAKRFIYVLLVWLCIANESIVFCEIEEAQMVEEKGLLGLYESASSQQVNFTKSEVVFSKGIPAYRKRRIVHFLHMRVVISRKKYLGLPTIR